MAELIWDGKLCGRQAAGPVRVALPFQTIETVNESTADRQRTLDLFAAGRQTEWRNRLIWGDKKYVLPSLLPEFAGKVNLIYIDPPFDTGADFSFSTTIPDTEEEFKKQPSILEQKAYRDTWGRGLDSYLEWFYETTVLLRELLAENGSIYVHLDWHIGHYAKVILDEVFGIDFFVNEIAWHYFGFKRKTAKNFPRKHDVIFVYGKASARVWNVQYKAHRPEYVARFKKDENGRLYRDDVNPTAGGSRVIYLDDVPGDIVDSVWDDISPVNPVASERCDYATQKPEALLERIIRASSNEGDLVLDCFAGSGTTAAVTEKLNRRWITCDLGRFAIHTTRKRLLSIPGVKPFVVQNLGKYERQAWQSAEFRAEGKDALEEQSRKEAAYRKFILDLYHATPISGHAWLHGVKAGRMVHVGAVDAPVTIADVKAIARETWKAGKDKAAADILGWEFAFEMNETARQVAAESRVDVAFKKIPREVLEKKAVEQGDIQFFELGALSVEPKLKGREVTLKLADFVIPLDDVPEEARKAIKHWSQVIDYWAVDWDYKNDTFHNQWQSYRTRQQPDLELSARYEYPEPGTYRVVVKVIDLLGNDTTKTLEIKVK